MDFLSKYEKATGMVCVKESKLPEFKDEQEFHEYVVKHINDFLHIDLKFREKFLKDNGYEVTRANTVDISLSVKPQE